MAKRVKSASANEGTSVNFSELTLRRQASTYDEMFAKMQKITEDKPYVIYCKEGEQTALANRLASALRKPSAPKPPDGLFFVRRIATHNGKPCVAICLSATKKGMPTAKATKGRKKTAKRAAAKVPAHAAA